MLNFRRSNRETNTNSNQNDDGIERAPDGSPRLNFWDPALKESRKKYFKITGLTTLAVLICCFTLLPLYVGLYWSQEPDAYRLTVRIIDLDSQASPSTSTFPAVLGPAVTQSVEQDLREKPNFHLGWQFEPDLERFSLNGENGNDRGIDADEYARHIVLNQDVFAAVVIHPNATTAFNQAFRSGSADYQPNGAVSLYYEEARNFYSTNQYVAFYTSIMLESAFASAASTFTSRVLSEASSATGGFNFTALSTSIAPQPPFSSVNSTSLLTQPFSRSTFNLRPFDQLAGVSATTAGEIYLIIFTFFIGLGFKQAFDPLAPKLTLGSELFLRIAVPCAGYFWISCHYSLVSLAFQVDFTRKYGMVGFFLFWMMNFVSMSGLGFVMEFVLLALGPLYFPIFLLFWVILNVTGAFVDLSDQSIFYLYNFVLPVYNAVDAAKSIMFGTKNHLLQNFVVSTSWLIFGASAILLTAVYKRSKASRDARAKREKTQ